MDKIVDWYEEGLDHIYDNDNNGYTFGIYYVKAKNKIEAESLIENGAYNNVVDENIETKSSRHIEEIK